MLQVSPVAFFSLTGHEIHYCGLTYLFYYSLPSQIAHVFAVTYREQRFAFSAKYLAGFGEKLCSICLLCASGTFRKFFGFLSLSFALFVCL